MNEISNVLIGSCLGLLVLVVVCGIWYLSEGELPNCIRKCRRENKKENFKKLVYGALGLGFYQTVVTRDEIYHDLARVEKRVVELEAKLNIALDYINDSLPPERKFK